MCNCCEYQTAGRKRRPGLIGIMLRVVALWVFLVFAGGTLVNTGHPVAVEAGKLMQTVTLVEPFQMWADGNGLDGVSNGIQLIARGVPMHVFS